MNALRQALIIVGLFSLLCYSVTEGADWISYGGSTDGDKAYYDKSSITSPSKGVVIVWARIVYGKELVEERDEKAGNKYVKLASDNTLVEINCIDKTGRFIAVIKYTSSGERIISTSDFPSSSNPIPSGSVLEGLYKAICSLETKK